MEFEKNNLEALKARQQEVAQRIMQLDASGTKNEEWNRLHNEYEQLTAQIDEMSSLQEKLAA